MRYGRRFLGRGAELYPASPTPPPPADPSSRNPKWLELLHVLFDCHYLAFMTLWEIWNRTSAADIFPTFHAFRCSMQGSLRKWRDVYEIKPIFANNPYKYMISLNGLRTLRRKGLIDEDDEYDARHTVLMQCKKEMDPGRYTLILTAIRRYE